MSEKNLLHIRISKDMKEKIDVLIEKGLFSNKGEVVREVIRSILLKYKDEIEDKK